jgi:hypothetical protein
MAIRASRRAQQHLPPFIPDTNAIEVLNRQLRKAIKTKGSFPTEDAARKLIYLAIANAGPQSTRTHGQTKAILAFKIHFKTDYPTTNKTAHTKNRHPRWALCKREGALARSSRARWRARRT